MKKILILSHTGDISFFKIGSHHYANGLAKNAKVSYIGTPISFFHKIMLRKPSGEKKLNDEIKILYPKTLFPITLKYNSLFSFVNRKLWGRSSTLSQNEMIDVVICDYPFYEPLLPTFNYKLLIYRPTDNYIQMSGRKVIRYEKKIIEKSNVIVATSNDVLENLRLNDSYDLQGKKTFVISNGYDDLHFNNFAESSERVGSVYIGSLDYRFDFDALDTLCRNYPNHIFDIYGPIDKNSDSIVSVLKSKHLNLKFYGAVSYNDVPDILIKYKIGLLLLNDHSSNKGRSPMKLWEYAASGLQVLYSQIEQDSVYDFLHKYDSSNLVQKFITAYNKEVGNDEYANLNMYSWDGKVSEMNKIISEFINE